MCPSGTHDTPPASAILGRECVPCSLPWRARTCVYVCMWALKVRRICWVSFYGKSLFASRFQTINMKPIPQRSVGRVKGATPNGSEFPGSRNENKNSWLFAPFSLTRTHMHTKKAPIVKTFRLQAIPLALGSSGATAAVWKVVHVVGLGSAEVARWFAGSGVRGHRVEVQAWFG